MAPKRLARIISTDIKRLQIACTEIEFWIPTSLVQVPIPQAEFANNNLSEIRKYYVFSPKFAIEIIQSLHIQPLLILNNFRYIMAENYKLSAGSY